MRDLFQLLMPKWRSALNSGRDPGSRAKGYLLAALGVLVWAGIYIGGFLLMNYIKGTEMDAVPGITEMIGDLINKVLLSMVFLTFLALLVFSNIITALNTYFMSEDLQILASLPVRKDELFFSRLTETLLESSWMILLFGLPFFLAYGAVNSAPWYYYALQPAVIIPFILVPAGIGVIVTMALVNAFPARRMRDILFLLSVSGAGILFLLVRLLRPERLVNPEAQETVFQFLLTLRQPMNVWLPSYWCTEIFYRLAQGKVPGTGFYLVLLMTSGLAAVVLANWFSRRYYQESLSKAQEATRAPISRTSPVQWVVRTLATPFRPDTRQLLMKEIRVFLRDTSQWSQVFLLAALVVIYIFNFRVLPLDQLPLDQFAIRNAVSYMNLGLAGFVISALSARFVFPMVSLEGRAFWVIKSSPITLSGFLWTKFLIAIVPLLVIGEFLIIVTDHFLRVSPSVFWISVVTMFFMTFGIVSMGVGLGAIYPRFNFENPAKIAVGFGGVIYMVLSIIYIGIIVFLEAYPAYVIFVSRHYKSLLSAWSVAGVFLCFALVLAVIVLATWLPVRLGLRNLERMEVA